MSIGRDEVLHVAKLAELAVREEDLDRLVAQMNRIVDYVAQLDQVPAGPARRAVPARPARRWRSARTCPVRCRSRARRPSWRPSSPRASSSCRGTAPWRISERGAPSLATPARGSPRRSRGSQRDPALVAGAARRRGGAGGRHGEAGPACRHADRDQGQHRHRRAADHLRARGFSRGTSRPTTRPSWTGFARPAR